MTISKGDTWGRSVPRPTDLQIAADDAQLARSLGDHNGQPTAVESGDMFRTVGARSPAGRSDLMKLPLDLIRCRLDGGAAFPVVAHVVARRPVLRGGFWRGPVLAVMNAEWIGGYDIAPRGHPNDGRVETLLVGAELTVRQRVAVRSRLRNATHLPHPSITSRSVRTADWTFDQPMVVVADGRVVGRHRHVAIEVEADAAMLFA